MAFERQTTYGDNLGSTMPVDTTGLTDDELTQIR